MPTVAARGARLRLLATELVVARQLQRLVEDGWIIAAVVEPAGRRAIGKLIWLHEVAAPDFDRIEAEPVGEPVHHALGLEVQMTARVAAIGPGEALVGHDHRSVDFEMLEAVGTDEVPGRTEAAARLRAADVAADIVEPLETHPEDRAVLARRHLAVGHAIRPARRRQQMLAPVLDPLDRHARAASRRARSARCRGRSTT